MMTTTTMALAIPITPVQIGVQTVQAVNARELHTWLEVNTRFNDWIERRIKEYGFIEGQDFCYSNLSSKEGRGGHNAIEYFITIDMAKELAMVERTDKGKEARQYFIAIEKQYRNVALAMQQQGLSPAQRAANDVEALYRIVDLFKINPSYATQKVAVLASRSSGFDVTELLTQSEHMNNVPDEHVMLEPTELGKALGYSAREMNIKLSELGLQVKAAGGQWIATPEGEQISERHAWASGNKSGYNLKWKLSAVRARMRGF